MPGFTLLYTVAIYHLGRKLQPQQPSENITDICERICVGDFKGQFHQIYSSRCVYRSWGVVVHM